MKRSLPKLWCLTGALRAGELPSGRTFGDVPEGPGLLYLNSLMNVSFALNMGDFAKQHRIASGAEWSVRVERTRP